ncbi:hypothetical protein Leryth_006682 [Lithospermum erythrorhizon]|nr:hypothetical protein Leryth_006682 [Lithospermum erythrorhizon]
MGRAGGMTNAVNVGIAVEAHWENREFISQISLNILVQFGKLFKFPFFFFRFFKNLVGLLVYLNAD